MNNSLGIFFENEERIPKLEPAELVKLFPIADHRPQLGYQFNDYGAILAFQTTTDTISEDDLEFLRINVYDKMFDQPTIKNYHSVIETINGKQWIVVNMTLPSENGGLHTGMYITSYNGQLFLSSMSSDEKEWDKWGNVFINVIQTLEFNVLEDRVTNINY